MTPRKSATLAVAGLAAGVALAIGLAQLQGQGNYRHEGFLEGFLQLLVAGLALSWLGSYLALAGPWVRGATASPGLVATAASVGSYALAWVGGLLGVPVLTWVVGLASAWGAAFVAAQASLPAWKTPRARGLHVALVTLVVVIPVVALLLPTSSFPGNAAPLAVRRAWAQQTFGEDYDGAEAYLRANPLVRERLGEVQAVAPVEGPNRTAQSPGERMGTFTLELDAQKGRTIAHLEMMRTTKATYRGTLETPQGPLPLEP